MVKLYLIPGHGQGDSGAVGGGYTEADLVRRLATRIKEMGGEEVETSDYSLNCYANSGLLNWDFPSGAQIVELHMDSADGDARGAHVIYKAGYTPDAYDEALAARLSSMLPGRANALVGRSDLKDVNQAAVRGVPYRLVEHGFISSDHDRQYFIDHMDEIAQAYLDVFGISQGPVDEDVRYMQGLARPMCERAGIEPPEATGQWTPDTQRALVHLAQTELMATCDPTLYPSGSIGGQSRAVMDAHPVKAGDAGLAAWAVKAALVGHGYKGADVGGVWSGIDLTGWTMDEVAVSALRRFQAESGLPVTGEVDDSGWCTLCPNMYSDNPNR